MATTDRIADLEAQVRELKQLVQTAILARDHQRQPRVTRVCKIAMPPDAADGDPFVAVIDPWIIFLDGPDNENYTDRSVKAKVRARMARGKCPDLDTVVLAHWEHGAWWIDGVADTTLHRFVSKWDFTAQTVGEAFLLTYNNANELTESDDPIELHDLRAQDVWEHGNEYGARRLQGTDQLGWCVRKFPLSDSPSEINVYEVVSWDDPPKFCTLTYNTSATAGPSDPWSINNNTQFNTVLYYNGFAGDSPDGYIGYKSTTPGVVINAAYYQPLRLPLVDTAGTTKYPATIVDRVDASTPGYSQLGVFLHHLGRPFIVRAAAGDTVPSELYDKFQNTTYDGGDATGWTSESFSASATKVASTIRAIVVQRDENGDLDAAGDVKSLYFYLKPDSLDVNEPSALDEDPGFAIWHIAGQVNSTNNRLIDKQWLLRKMRLADTSDLTMSFKTTGYAAEYNPQLVLELDEINGAPQSATVDLSGGGTVTINVDKKGRVSLS